MSQTRSKNSSSAALLKILNEDPREPNPENPYKPRPDFLALETTQKLLSPILTPESQTKTVVSESNKHKPT